MYLGVQLVLCPVLAFPVSCLIYYNREYSCKNVDFKNPGKLAKLLTAVIGALIRVRKRKTKRKRKRKKKRKRKRKGKTRIRLIRQRPRPIQDSITVTLYIP